MENQRPPHGIFESAGSKTLGWTQGLLIAALVIVLLLLLVWIYSLWRNKRLGQPRLIKNPWDMLRHDLMLGPSLGAPEHMGIMNHTLRKALELKTAKPFSAWTSMEILRELQRDEAFSSDFQTQCAQFLMTSDQVLFALEPLDEETRKQWNVKISAWLESLQFGRPL